MKLAIGYNSYRKEELQRRKRREREQGRLFQLVGPLRF